ncbi:PREDICTED: uncharacterized protein LOC105562976 [Vollenhovia emeryi]|uniref:uncharacterized protein LOC105562976 n=1 Tax=Vollenhovia emeryi TaxID=411798 RepID=UPI0005F4B1BD|nr:PREDICTED: uncharacterized protein LOC105562976 [Vollenhovia emeryi]
MTLNNNAIDYVHWDDPNELVDRLRLLDASRRASHNAHDNEMLSIIEELREAGFIVCMSELLENIYRTILFSRIPLHQRSHHRDMRPSKSSGRNDSEKRRLVEELHAPARKNFPRRHVIVRGYDDLWQADLVDMQAYSRFNRGYHYILTVIDVLSKHAWAVPLKIKGGSETADAIAEIIRESERCPRNLQTDKGKEFYNTYVQRLLKKQNINLYSTYSIMKASVVERFNRTLKNAMWKMFTLNGSYKWTDLLPRLTAEYNARKHRTIGMRPVDVTPAVANRLLKTVYSHVKIAGPARFKVDDAVRVSRYKTIFEKGYTPNWTTEVFKIVTVQHTNPVTYLLQDYRGEPVAGAFYEYELHRATNPDVYLVEKVLRRKGDKVYVKWLGFDGSHNSWIDKNNVV